MAKESTINIVIQTNMGDIKAELYPDVAPITVKDFTDLIKKGFYDGLTFHRVIAGFMIQGGCPKGNGTGGPGYCIKGEFAANGVKNDLKHERGVLSMARAMAPDSAGSQFFIMHRTSPHLDGQYAAFGVAADETSVLTAIEISKTPTRSVGYYDDVPVTPVAIKKVKIRRGGKDE